MNTQVRKQAGRGKKPEKGMPKPNGSMTAAQYQIDAARLTTAEERREMVARAAYYHAEKRGFEPGHEIEDWLAGEAEIETTHLLPTLAGSTANAKRSAS